MAWYDAIPEGINPRWRVRRPEEEEETNDPLDFMEQLHRAQSMKHDADLLNQDQRSEPGSVVSEKSDPVGRGLDVARNFGQREYLDQYAQHLAAMPNREDYKPSVGRKILAVLAGTLAGGNPAVTDTIANSKYNRAMQDWGRKAGNLGEVADLEGKRFKDTSALGRTAMTAGAAVRGQDIGRLGDVEAHERGTEANRINRGNLETRILELEQKKLDAKNEEERKRLEREIDRAKLEVDRINAGANVTRARATEANVQSLSETRKNREKMESMSPKDQEILDEVSAASVIARNPDKDWGRFLNNKTGRPEFSGGWLSSDEEDMKEFEAFLAEVDAERKRRGGYLRRGTYGTEAVDPLGGGE